MLRAKQRLGGRKVFSNKLKLLSLSCWLVGWLVLGSGVWDKETFDEVIVYRV